MTGTQPEQRSAEELRADLGALRGDVGDTVEELVNRADVPARVRATREAKTEQVKQQVEQARAVVAEKAPAVDAAMRERPALVAGAALVLIGLLIGRRRRNQRRRQAG